jgi:HEAT repeat protein
VLAERLQEADPHYRVYQAKAIWKIEPTSPVVFPTILEVLKDMKTPRGGYGSITRMVDGKRIEIKSPLKEPVAYTAAQALGEMGPAAALAVPALVEALNCGNSDVAHAVMKALGDIGPAAQAAVGPLSKLASSDDPRRAEALYSLKKIAPDAAAEIMTADTGLQDSPPGPAAPLR